MKWIHTNQEYYACVDDEDYDKVSMYLWRYLNKSGYARCDELDDLLLHEFVMGKPPEGFEIDHINRAPWDNRKSNLRIVEKWQNQKNKGLPLSPPFPTEEEMLSAKNQRYDTKYGERHRSIRSLKIRGQHKHQKNHHARRAVVDDLGNRFESVIEAAVFYNIKSPSNISLCCLGKKKKTAGRAWSYA